MKKCWQCYWMKNFYCLNPLKPRDQIHGTEDACKFWKEHLKGVKREPPKK